MGTVHGVYLKYVGLSAISFGAFTYLSRDDDAATTQRSLQELVSTVTAPTGGVTTLAALLAGYSCIVNGIIAILFKLEVGMGLIGKDRSAGTVPFWSYVLWVPFHFPTYLYTFLHTKVSDVRKQIPVATQVQPGWYVGGCYGHELSRCWAGVIDLTVEFPETCTTTQYLSIPCWDGVPASPEQLEHGANFAVAALNKARNTTGSDADCILVHCAHGRGRSTTMMCACLVKAGLYKNWQDAFAIGIKPQRSVCKLNRRMKQALTEWQRLYVDSGGLTSGSGRGSSTSNGMATTTTTTTTDTTIVKNK